MASSAAQLPQAKCISCGAWGKGVVSKADGMCDYCRKNVKNSDVTVGQKRPRPAEFDSDRGAEDIQALLAQADAVDLPELDTDGVKKMLLQFEKRITVNIQQRARHPDDPKQYLESEIALDQAIKSLYALAAVPDQYNTLIRSGSIASLHGLLAHENADIAISVLQLYNELCKEDSVGDAPASGLALGKALLEEGGADMMLQGVCRLNDDTVAQDSEGMLAACELFLSLADLCGSEACLALASVTASGAAGGMVGGVKVAKGTPLLFAFALGRVARKDMDDLKGLSAELLAVYLSSSSPLSLTLGRSTFPYTTPKGQAMTVDGVEALLQVVNVYKKRQPDTLSSAEKEVVENILDALATVLLQSENQERFQAAEGFELLLRTVRENSYARAGALRCLDFAVVNNMPGCLAFISCGGLKSLFPALRGKGLAQTKRWHGVEAAEGEEQRSVSTLASLMAAVLPPVGPSPAALDGDMALCLARLLAKIGEGGQGQEGGHGHGHGHIGRLLELRAKYSSKVEAGMDDPEQEEEDEDEDVDEEERAYLSRQRHGLFTLQRIDAVLAAVLTSPTRVQQAVAEVGQPSEEEAAAVPLTLPALLTLASTVSLAVRSALYEQGASIVALLEVLGEAEGRMGAGREKEDLRWTLQALESLAGLTPE